MENLPTYEWLMCSEAEGVGSLILENVYRISKDAHVSCRFFYVESSI